MSSGYVDDATVLSSMWPKDPGASVYFLMYQLGLRGISWDSIVSYANFQGKILREKDAANWARGYMKNQDPFAIEQSPAWRQTTLSLDQFSVRPAGYREPIDCWVPCSAECRPLVKWSKTRCTEAQAWAYRNCEILGKNLRGMKLVVIDVDGDHTGEPDWDVINYWSRFINYTFSRVKVDNQGRPISFHLEFYTDRIIPTMHFHKLDLLGNMNNQIQYLKPNKVENRIPRAPLDDYILGELNAYSEQHEYARLDRAYDQR